MLRNDIIIKENLKALHISVTQLHELSKTNENCNNPKKKVKLEIALTNNLRLVRDLLNNNEILTKNISHRLSLLSMVVRELTEKGGGSWN